MSGVPYEFHPWGGRGSCSEKADVIQINNSKGVDWTLLLLTHKNFFNEDTQTCILSLIPVAK